MSDPDPRAEVSRLSREERARLARRLAEKRAGKGADAGGLPAVEPRPDQRHEPFPLTELQEAYWLGRQDAFQMGRVATQSYVELESEGLELDRAVAAWRQLVRRHEMLRAVVRPDGRQQILPEVDPYRPEVVDLRGESQGRVEEELVALRERMSHEMLAPDEWPLFELRAARLPGGRLRLFVKLDGLIVDGRSMATLFREWGRLCEDPDAELPELDLSFRDYVLAREALAEGEAYQRDREYWIDRVADLPPAPKMPRRPGWPASGEQPRFRRRVARLDAERWERLQSRAAERGLTPTAVLLAAYADVLSLWAEERHFTLSVPRANRLPLHPEVERVVGEFASFTLLEVDNRGQRSFAERARGHQRRLVQDLEHSLFGGVEVLRELARRRDESLAFMPVVFTGMLPEGSGGVGPALDVPHALGRLVYAVNQSSQVTLDNHVREREGALEVEWDAVDRAYPDGMPEAMLDAYVRHLEGLADDDEGWEAGWTETGLELLPSSHLEVRRRANDNDAPIPELLVHQLLDEPASRRPDRPAVVAPDRTLTFRQLDLLANRWGRWLRRNGAEPGRLVGVVMQKGWEQAVAVHGVLRSGAAYVPLDPRDPPARRAALLQRSRVDVVLTQGGLARSLEWPDGVRAVPVDAGPPDEVSDAPLDALQGPDDLAFVLYTSGSTGEPKGVKIRHRGVVNALADTQRTFGVSGDDRVLGVTALHHDMSLFDVFGVPAAGGAVVIPEPEGRRDPGHWAELMREHGVTLWNSVPAMMEMLLEHAEATGGGLPGSLRLAFLGGDWIPVTLPGRLSRQVPGARVVSVGGPTETTLWNIWYPVEEVDPEWRSVPYGRPVANTSYHVLDGDRVDRPLWVPGELWVSGPGLTEGYWDDEEATREKFDVHPRTGERIFDTGDLGRYLPDGDIEFLGRSDLQVQIRGQRIEPAEVEAALARHEGVRAAVVRAVGEARGEKRLVAYVVAAAGREAPAPEALRAHLEARVPAHMLPAAYVELDELPLTRNGKVDRDALPAPEGPAPAPGRGAAGGTREAVPAPSAEERTGEEGASAGRDVVERVERLVCEALSLEDVEPDRNLLEYGADSIDMVRLGNRLEEAFGARPRIDEIFRLQTVRAIASFYRDAEVRPRQAADEGPPPGEAAGGGPPRGRDADVRQILAGYRVTLDPDERERLKERQPGIRRDLEGEGVALEAAGEPDEMRREWWRRRSHRRFGLRPVPLGRLAGLLEGLRRLQVHGGAKYLYPSPGGFYPTQLYLHAKPGRVEGLRPGTYYYHPVEHRLVPLVPDADVPREVHIPFVNAPVFDEAAFSLFLVADLDAIGPAYGERSLHFVTLEAGVMAYLLERRAPDWGLGLCQIGDVEFDRIRDLFRLGPRHHFVHSLVGGPVAAEGPESREIAGDAEDAADRLADRIRDLSPEEVEALLEAHREEGERDP